MVVSFIGEGNWSTQKENPNLSQITNKFYHTILQFNFISGETTAETSLFEYTDGKQWSDYSHQDFVPIFIDEFNQTMINKSYEVCGGSSDQYKACIFDYLATFCLFYWQIKYA
jgi:hypothetical protein